MNARRLELLLVAQQQLRRHPSKLNANHLFEIERAIELIQAGCTCSQTATVERWVESFLQRGGVAV